MSAYALEEITPRAGRNEPVDLVAAHLAARRIQRSLTAAAAMLAALVLAATLWQGYQLSRPVPDLVTFAFRV